MWNGKTSTDSFADRFEFAAAEFPSLAEAFLNNAPGKELTGGRNSSGVCMEDETVAIAAPTL